MDVERSRIQEVAMAPLSMHTQGRTIGMWRHILFRGLVFDVLTLAVWYALAPDLLSVRNALVLVLVGGPTYGCLTWLFRTREARPASQSASPQQDTDTEERIGRC